MKLLEGKVALVTGGNRGIGKAVAVEFAKHGAMVAFTYVSEGNSYQETLNSITALGGSAKAYQSNAADYTAAEKLVNDVMTDFGKIDICVNNAGITRDGLLMRMSEADWDNVITTNLKSVFNITKAVMKPMMKQRNGSIINMSSVVGIEGNGGQSNYAASKAGIIGFSKSIAIEIGSRNVRTNVIAPGFIETDMTAKLDPAVKENWIKDIPLNRIGIPEDVANVAVFLASDLSSYVNGQVIPVCGGMVT
ncbi:MAG: 3-oxoacyl-[acyl-carrier-protein] reductase [Flavobacteriales bacterium]|nr:3-oxoacyl-[acyl-carrier-protein] reductase [Flavobacteriales bacterium]